MVTAYSRSIRTLRFSHEIPNNVVRKAHMEACHRETGGFSLTTKPNITHMSKTAKKATAKKRGSKPNSAKVIDADIFKIEETPPPHRFRGTTPAVEAMKEKIKRTVEQLKPGQAFIIPSEHRATARKFLNEAYPDQLFVTASVPSNDTVVRIYLRKSI